MVYRFNLTGSFTAGPARGQPPGIDDGVTPLLAIMDLAARDNLQADLTTDSAQAINLAFSAAFAAGAHVVIAQVEFGDAVLQYNAGAGVQAITLDSLFVYVSTGHPLQSLTLTRRAGVLTTVHLFVGAKAVP